MHWVSQMGKGVCVYAPENSAYLRSQMSAARSEAESALRCVERLLEVHAYPGLQVIRIYLVDKQNSASAFVGAPLTVGASEVIEDSKILRVMEPGLGGMPLAWPIISLAVEGHFGAQAAGALTIAQGVAGVVAAYTGTGASFEKTDELLRQRIADGQSVSLFHSPIDEAEEEAARNALSGQASCTSFVRFLLDNYGRTQLRQFFLGYDLQRPDKAALIAFNKPLGVLEEQWLASLKRTAVQRGSSRQFWHLIVPLFTPFSRYRLRAAEIALCLAFGVAATLTMPVSSKLLIDAVVRHLQIPGKQDAQAFIWTQLAPLCILLLIVHSLNTLVTARRIYLSTWLSQHALMELRVRLFTRLQQMPHSFYARHRTGDIASRFTEDIQLVAQALTNLIATALFQVLVSAAAALLLLRLSPLLGGMVLLVVPLFGVLYRRTEARIEAASKDHQKRGGEIAAALQENLSAFSVIKAFTLENEAAEAFRKRLRDQLHVRLRLRMVTALSSLGQYLTTIICQIIILGVGGYLAIAHHDQVTVGTLAAFNLLLPTLFGPVATLSDVGQAVQMASGAVVRIREILDEPLQILDSTDARDLQPLTHEVRFKQVCFNYDPEQRVLQDLDLMIPAGLHTAIVGPSGSGKSTIANLLLRFWDPQSGNVLYDGSDIRDITMRSLRGRIGIVFQDTFVFDTTLRENIAIGRPDATDQEIGRALHQAGLDSYVQSLPAGYNAVLGERGIRMSGGQRQRLAIARALLRSPDLLILDEATSSLDSQTERRVLETLMKVAERRTIISITHRLSVAAIADRIVVLDGGKVVQEGTHDELVRRDGLYQRLYHEQVAGSARLVIGGELEVEAASLRNVPLFTDMEEEDLALIASHLLPERFPAGQDVVRQGDAGDRLYIIMHGEVEFFIRHAGQERHVNTLQEGDYFGEIALLKEKPRTATARTRTAVLLYGLLRKDFNELIKSKPSVHKALSDAATFRAQTML